VLRELTLPFLTDTVIYLALGWILKFRGKLSERWLKTSPLRKVDVGLHG